MSIDQKFLNLFIKATEKAAIGASKFIGKNDKIAADKGAVDPMRRELNKINMEGTIVIGEGEMDEAPMLYIDEIVGNKNSKEDDGPVQIESIEHIHRQMPDQGSDTPCIHRRQHTPMGYTTTVLDIDVSEYQLHRL